MEYRELVDLYENMSSTTKRLLKTYYLSEFLKKADIGDLSTLIKLIRGKVFDDNEEEKLGISSRLILKAIGVSTGMTQNEIENEWKNTGDLGLVAENLIKNKKQATLFSQDLTIKKVYGNIRKLPSIEGTGSVDTKIKLISKLLTSAKPEEAKYIVRTVLEEMRMGIGDGSIRDAFLWNWFKDELKISYDEEANNIVFDESKRETYNEYNGLIQRAFDITNDFSRVAKLCKEGVESLRKIELEVGSPIKVMLCQKVSDIKEGFEKLGKPAQVEFKYDGFRMQIHKTKDEINLYTRRLDNVTKQFPEVIDYLRKHVAGDDYIIDCEAVGYDEKTGKYMPFQHISQRIKRKHNIEELSKKLPVELNIFDVLFHNGKSYIHIPLNERMKKLKEMIDVVPKKIRMATLLVTSNEEEAQNFYQSALDAGEEGVIMKKLDGPYKPGNRTGGWVKIKPVMEALDVIITGAEWGEGKRSSWLTSFNISIINDFGEFLEIGKVGTGIKEVEGDESTVTFDKITEMLKPLIAEENGKEVIIRPHVVIEVNYEEIQKSNTYSSGYALRFPRFMRLRDDKSPDDASTSEMVEEFYYSQK
jgi:DNA ligase-1